jgi:hypothetical protein
MTKRLCVEVVAACALLCGCSYVADTDDDDGGSGGGGGRGGASGSIAGAGAGGSSGRGGSGGRSGSGGGGGLGSADPGEDAGADPDTDAGSEAGSGGGGAGCIDGALSWGQNGGRVAYQDRHTLAPCRAFSIARSMQGTPGADLNCANEVGASADVTADDIDAALAHADVLTAFADAPVLYGRDTRPFDGTVFQIEVAADVIEVGSDCAGQLGCVPVPAGVQALRTALEALTAQQRMLPDCDQLP